MEKWNRNKEYREKNITTIKLTINLKDYNKLEKIS